MKKKAKKYKAPPDKPEKPRMPQRFPDDHPIILALLDESERCTGLAMRWVQADKPNPVAAQMLYQHGYSHALSAAWLRCYLKGELLKKPTPAEKL